MEELVKRNLTERGMKFGPYEYFNVGDTTIATLRRFKIIPDRNYEAVASKKPDGLLVDRRDPNNIRVIAVVESKAPNEFDTPQKRDAASDQCALDYCKPLSALLGVVTDGSEYIWLNPQLPADEYEKILREDGYPLHLPFLWTGAAEIKQTLEIVGRLVTEISPTNSALVKEEAQNPSNLAERVWQSIWLASGENPDRCLATFVELFVFKYLSDLGVLRTNNAGVAISFSDALKIEASKSLHFYFENVRSYIKTLFPPSSKDGTSIINGIILSPSVEEHNYLFYKLLREFDAFGPLNNIDPEFKSRLYENFLKKSMSQKNWGQFFTPRNVIKAMLEMSDIELLADGSTVHDPACGVGGFILEPLVTKRPRDFVFDDGHLSSKLRYSGYDRDEKTIILAKANMLIHLNELVRANPTSTAEFARMFNETFTSLHTSILGSLSVTETDEFDLIMTNPPFVVAGTSKTKEFISDNGQLKQYYAINGTGVEGLFLEKIVRSLKPGGKALVIVPDGILNRLGDSKLRRFVCDECFVDAIISLPINTFYTTPKKTYILALTKKPVRGEVQVDPVYTYVVVNTGETLDAKRFETSNDLPEMVRQFKYFKADKDKFVSPTVKCKVWPVEKFNPEKHWSIDRWLSEDERRQLGLLGESDLVSVAEFADRLEEEKQMLDDAIRRLRELGDERPEADFWVEVPLSDPQYFELFIGKRVLSKDLYYGSSIGTVPVYSANPREPIGMMEDSNIEDFVSDFVLWGIDGNFDFNVIRRGTPFRTTDHCGAIRIIDTGIDPDYLYLYLNWIKNAESLDRQLRANLRNMKGLIIRFPVLVNEDLIPQTKPLNREAPGDERTEIFDLDRRLQEQISIYYRTVEAIKQEIAARSARIASLDVSPIEFAAGEVAELVAAYSGKHQFANRVPVPPAPRSSARQGVVSAANEPA